MKDTKYQLLNQVIITLNSHRGIYDSQIQHLLTPSGFRAAYDEFNAQLPSRIETIAAPDWKQAITYLVAATYDTNLERKVENLQNYVKILTREASHNSLWLTRIVSQNCKILSDLVCNSGNKDMLESAAATIRQVFRVTVSDYTDEEPQQGRTLECHTVACILLRIYVRMMALPLAEGILQAIKQYSPHIPPLTMVDWQTQVQFSFYRGMFAFHDQEYKTAADNFAFALDACAKNHEYRMNKNQFECMMRLYIPAQYIAYNRAPSSELYDLVPNLKPVFQPVITSCRQGNFLKFMQCMEKNSDFLQRRRLFMAFEFMLTRLRLNLLRRVWLINEKPKRLPIQAFVNALKAAHFPVSDTAAGEYYIAQMISHGDVKGYIHHGMGMLMLSKTQPFPSLVKPITAL